MQILVNKIAGNILLMIRRKKKKMSSSYLLPYVRHSFGKRHKKIKKSFADFTVHKQQDIFQRNRYYLLVNMQTDPLPILQRPFLCFARSA